MPHVKIGITMLPIVRFYHRVHEAWYSTMIPLRSLLALQSVAVGFGALLVGRRESSFYQTLYDADWGTGWLALLVVAGMWLGLATVIEGAIRYAAKDMVCEVRDHLEVCLTGQAKCGCNSLWVRVVRTRTISYWMSISVWSGLTTYLWFDGLPGVMDLLAPIQVAFTLWVAINDATQVRKVLHREEEDSPVCPQ